MQNAVESKPVRETVLLKLDELLASQIYANLLEDAPDLNELSPKLLSLIHIKRLPDVISRGDDEALSEYYRDLNKRLGDLDGDVLRKLSQGESSALSGENSPTFSFTRRVSQSFTPGSRRRRSSDFFQTDKDPYTSFLRQLHGILGPLVQDIQSQNKGRSTVTPSSDEGKCVSSPEPTASSEGSNSPSM